MKIRLWRRCTNIKEVLGSYMRIPHQYKIQGLEILVGRSCHIWNCPSDNGSCSYKATATTRRLTNVIDFLHLDKVIKVSPLYEGNLSGTPLCPKHIKRVYTCFDCVHGNGDRRCHSIERNKLVTINYNLAVDHSEEGKYKQHCKFFDLSSYGDNWDRETGKHI